MKHLQSHPSVTSISNHRWASSTKLAVLLLASAGLVAACGGGGGATAKLVKTHIPAAASTVGGLNAQAILSSDLLKSLTGGKDPMESPELKAWAAKTKVDPRSIKSVAFGLSELPVGAQPKDLLVVVAGDFDAAALQGAVTLIQTEGGTNLGGLAEPAVLRTTASGELLVGTSTWVNAETTDGARDENLAKVAEAVDTGAAFWMSTKLPAELTSMGGGAMQMAGLKEMPSHGALSVDLSGGGLAFKGAILIPGADAGALASKLNGLLKMIAMTASGPEADLMKSLDLSGSGDILTATLSMSSAQIAAAAQSGALPF